MPTILAIGTTTPLTWHKSAEEILDRLAATAAPSTNSERSNLTGHSRRGTRATTRFVRKEMAYMCLPLMLESTRLMRTLCSLQVAGFVAPMHCEALGESRL